MHSGLTVRRNDSSSEIVFGLIQKTNLTVIIIDKI